MLRFFFFFFFSSRRRHTRFDCDWSSDVCSSDLLAISNGIRPEPYLQEPPPLLQRRPDIVMAARFARQKDHATLLRALVVLRQRGLTPTLTLAGGGKARAQQAAQRLSAELRSEEH